MATFLTSLWESIFTPGPTPTLLIATNASFGALQILLLVLLAATQSIHFVVLSFLCGGLWYSINWFAAEVQAAKAKDDAEKTQQQQQKDRRLSPEPGSDTETETDTPPRGMGTGTEGTQKAQRRKAAPNPTPVGPVSITDASREPPARPEGSPGLLQPSAPGPVRKASSDSDQQQRRRSLADSDYVSTDSEWEKVSGDEGKREDR